MTTPRNTKEECSRTDVAPSSGIGHDESRRAYRRRLLQGGLAAAPVIATLASRPAFAAGQCMSVTVFASLQANPATSLRPGTFAQCHSHGYWKQRVLPDDPRTFAGVGFLAMSDWEFRFKEMGFRTITFGEATLYQVLWASGGDGFVLSFARDCVAAFLDATLYGPQAGYTAQQITDMWNGIMGPGPGMGNWSPSPGVTWYYDESRQWLDVLVGNKLI